MILKINQENPEQKKINTAVQILQDSGVIAYPTDTIYGLGCDIFKPKAVDRIFQLKKRPKKKSLSIMCSDFKQISSYAILTDRNFLLMKKILPGPYTFILKAKNKLPSTFLPKNKTVGIRIPDNKICQELIKTLGNPIITTSLNISGEQPLTNPDQLSKELFNKIDLVIDAGELGSEASTIIDLTTDSPQILRLGKGPVENILS